MPAVVLGHSGTGGPAHARSTRATKLALRPTLHPPTYHTVSALASLAGLEKLSSLNGSSTSPGRAFRRLPLDRRLTGSLRFMYLLTRVARCPPHGRGGTCTACAALTCNSHVSLGAGLVWAMPPPATLHHTQPQVACPCSCRPVQLLHHVAGAAHPLIKETHLLPHEHPDRAPAMHCNNLGP